MNTCVSFRWSKLNQTVTYAFIGFGLVLIEVEPICSYRLGRELGIIEQFILLRERSSSEFYVYCDAGYQGESLECKPGNLCLVRAV